MKDSKFNSKPKSMSFKSFCKVSGLVFFVLILAPVLFKTLAGGSSTQFMSSVQHGATLIGIVIAISTLLVLVFSLFNNNAKGVPDPSALFCVFLAACSFCFMNWGFAIALAVVLAALTLSKKLKPTVADNAD